MKVGGGVGVIVAEGVESPLLAEGKAGVVEGKGLTLLRAEGVGSSV